MSQYADQGNHADPLRLMIVVGSVRPGRLGLPVALWVHECVTEFGGFDIDFVDLMELDLPLVNEPNHPRFRRYTQNHTRAWSERVDAAEAFIFVTPEYNCGYAPALKNALDYLSQEWDRKPLGIVSYGGLAGGTRGVAALRPVLSALGLVAAKSAIELPQVALQIDDGFFTATERQRETMSGMLGELRQLDGALHGLRPASFIAS